MERLKWSHVRNMWCVKPTEHSNYLDVVEWCHNRLGQHIIENTQDGEWSYCQGDYYGMKIQFKNFDLEDRSLYFGFKDREDALFFILRWC